MSTTTDNGQCDNVSISITVAIYDVCICTQARNRVFQWDGGGEGISICLFYLLIYYYLYDNMSKKKKKNGNNLRFWAKERHLSVLQYFLFFFLYVYTRTLWKPNRKIHTIRKNIGSLTHIQDRIKMIQGWAKTWGSRSFGTQNGRWNRG